MSATKKISEERILQISNDISEDMGSHTKAELVQCVIYFRQRGDEVAQKYQAFRTDQIIFLSKRLQEIGHP